MRVRLTFDKEFLEFRPTMSRIALSTVTTRGAGDQFAIPKHGDAVGDRKDFFHAVADEENGHALLAQPIASVKSCSPHGRRKRCGWLVHDQTRTLSEMALAISTACCGQC